jgi:hypothetical protein
MLEGEGTGGVGSCGNKSAMGLLGPSSSRAATNPTGSRSPDTGATVMGGAAGSGLPEHCGPSQGAGKGFQGSLECDRAHGDGLLGLTGCWEDSP